MLYNRIQESSCLSSSDMIQWLAWEVVLEQEQELVLVQEVHLEVGHHQAQFK